VGVYATTTSLQTLMIGTTFDSLTTSLADKLITHAENEVNKYLSKRYNVTSFMTAGSVPPLVTSLTETLAEGYMHQRMSRGGKDAMKRGSELIEMAKENLESIAEYKLDLHNTAGSVISDMSQTAYRVLSNTTDYSSTFNEDDELNWAVDSDKTDDISDERDA
jgi:hypothetical protein